MNQTEPKILNRTTEAIVRLDPTPAFTESWRPYSHAQILDAMAIAVKSAGLEVVNKEYSMRPESTMIAAWEVAGKEKGFNFGISILNATDKKHAVTLGCFEKIFVCSNFCFRLEWERVMFRKHSGLLEIDELIFLAKGALGILIPKFKDLRAWHVGLLDKKLNAGQAALITIAAMRRKVVPPARFEEFQNLLFGSDSKYKSEADTLYAWHGAATELMNSNSLLGITWKQDNLNYFLDYEVPILMSGSDNPKMIDFNAVQNAGFAKYNADRTKRSTETREASKSIRDEYRDQEREKKIAIRNAKKAEKAETIADPKTTEKKETKTSGAREVQPGAKISPSASVDKTTKKIVKGRKTSKDVPDNATRIRKVIEVAKETPPKKKAKEIAALTKEQIRKKAEKEFKKRKRAAVAHASANPDVLKIKPRAAEFPLDIE